MIKKLFLLLVSITLILNFASSVHAQGIQRVMQYDDIPLRSCFGDESNACPESMRSVYTSLGESCATSFADFQQDPITKHFWVEDPEITTQGKANDRARQFIYWVINNNAIDNHTSLRQIWGSTRNIAYFLVVLVAAIMGIGFIVGQRSNFQINIKVWPSIGKIAMALLYITFSAAIVIFLIQLSEVIMKFFIERLGGNDLFTIYFTDGSQAGVGSEENYVNFYGCRDLNIRVQEAAGTEMFLFKATNITYYVMGSMIILRKILLWFMLFVSPFLAVLFPFVFIRNIGWVWIGVFFQWLFYGPLFALFLGALATIWKAGIPFAFDFSRVNKAPIDAAERLGYIYPTAINIVYGGPAQRGEDKIISALNNGSYVDTFAEYVITLIMLWAVIFFPWWLLRIFRDYCCDGIVAMKNILLSMYDQMRGAPGSPPPGPSPVTAPSFLKANIKMPKDVEVPVKVKLETIEEIKQTKTEDISRSLNLRASNLKDIAKFDTDRTSRDTVRKHLEYLSNPIKAETPAERQKFMNLRTELFNRAIRDDVVAKQILSATSTSAVEKIQRREEILKSTPAMTPITHVVSVKVKLPQEKVSSINGALVNAITASNQILTTIAQNTQITAQQVSQILTSFKVHMQDIKPATTTSKSAGPVTTNKIVETIAKETGIKQEIVVKVIKHMAQVVKSNKDVAKEVAEKENIKPEQLEQLVDAQIPAVAEPEKNVEETISIPPSISIEDYEEVKKMWTQQYEQGEVPITENIPTRQEWVEHDIVAITNTLNKLLAPNVELRQQGLDELGYILPIFLINNLKGEELMVYLKAKLEAAKEVKNRISKEKEVKEQKQTSKEEELVEVTQSKKQEAAKEMQVEQELKIPETPKSNGGNATPLKNPVVEKKS